MNQSKSRGGKQLSKAERYRWIIQEPKTVEATPSAGSNSTQGNKITKKSGKYYYYE